MDPEAVRRQTLEALGRHEIVPDLPHELIPPGLRYGPDYIEFFHQCCDGDLHYTRVVDDEVYMEFDGQLQRIDTIDEWETLAGRIVAFIYDPRWLITRLQDLQYKENEVGSAQLIGNFYPGEYGLAMTEPLNRLERETKEQILREFEYAPLDEFTAEQQEKFEHLKQEYEKLSVEELRTKIRSDALAPWGFEITLNETFLPVLVKTEEETLLRMRFPEEGLRFRYTDKNAGDETP